MNEAGFIDELQNATNMKVLVSKLPFRLRDKWRVAVFNIGEKCDRRLTFKDLLEFLEKQATTTSDPVYGEAQAPKERVIAKTSKPVYRSKANVATSVVPLSEQISSKIQPSHNQIRPEKENAVQNSCVFCNKRYFIEHCDSFIRKITKKRWSFVPKH